MGIGKPIGLAAADEADFRDYVVGQQARWLRSAYLLCGDPHLAEDLVSTVVGKLYRSWTKIVAAHNIDAYVQRMLMRAFIDETRRPWWRRERATADPPERADAGASGASSVEDRIVVRELMMALPPRRRAVLVLRFYEGLSIEQTAEALGCTAGTVKSQQARALASMRERFDGVTAGAAGQEYSWMTN
jgi:RNA polymerase sigma-70 factor (sigma-E family)